MSCTYNSLHYEHTFTELQGVSSAVHDSSCDEPLASFQQCSTFDSGKLRRRLAKSYEDIYSEITKILTNDLSAI